MAIKNAAKNTGMNHVKIISEVISSCLGNIDLNTFTFESSHSFLLCNFNAYDMQMFLVNYENNQFKIIASEKTSEV